ncbi:hypothetical protein VU08_04770 [Desulfobulbus sp. F5]|nr:hypothetical protein [Desulfobulbus sp. F5]
MNTGLVAEAAAQMAALPCRMQEMALRFIRELSLSGKRGVPGKNLLKYAGTAAPDDLKAMSEAIKSGCGQVDHHEW